MAKENRKQGKSHTEDEILKVLKEIDGCSTIAAVARAHGIPDQTIFRRRQKYAGMNGTELAELRSRHADDARETLQLLKPGQAFLVRQGRPVVHPNFLARLSPKFSRSAS